MEIDQVIAELSNLNLADYPEGRIRELLNEIGVICSMQVNFHPGKVVMRARPHENSTIRYRSKGDFSFKPQKFNNTYQRASTPYHTMFYATAIPDNLVPGELENMRIIGVTESIPALRDNSSSLYKKISFGKWQVIEDLRLMAIIHKDTYFGKSSYTRELMNAYNQATQNIPEAILQEVPDIIEKSFKIQTFLADEFAKEQISHDYDYMISAIFSEIAIKKGFDGIFYPSVRVGGEGFNIAITPEATKKLKLIVVGECSLYKHREHTVVGNDAILELKDEEEDFDLIDLPNNHQKECLEQIGLETLEELLKYQND
ncbi:Uncharacterised protein [Chryseobacterium nakagawai]|uniref:RES domain-containing protein n=1 Tax=Chryseobacterium nakagawai TaxID=1241982 RepID=A0AAD0YMJ6_CHRNA|nr:RES domain-containing protein [Chryseobacterium nakagawai]AZA91765.1 RES domain-containing protein [Chryseobacterium nakagawai]VEH18272.1 Uncharacterised protein [Chryseobacterium nakagawai]